ncbi:MAG: toprim domain-containing protein [Aureliella sp.]
MNIARAKHIVLSEFLSRLAYEPTTTKKDQLWYLSPFRHESEPSFKVNPALNAWYDFGAGRGGDIIDFVKQHHQLSSVSDALACIRRIQGSSPLPKQVHMPPEKRKSEPAVMPESIGRVKSKALLVYLKRRGVSLPLAASRVQEAHYRCGGKKYFGLAFANDSGGYELRNPMWKGTLGTKDITTIEQVTTERVAVFEGFFDYLAAVSMYGGDLNSTVVVLNSVAFRSRALNKLRDWETVSVELYRDTDAAGASLLDYFNRELLGCSIIDKAEMYPDHADLNDWYVDHLDASNPAA